jgi:holo-[acyl-carrier protein] synthase
VRFSDIDPMTDSRRPPLVGIDLVMPAEIQTRIAKNPALAPELFHAGEIAYAEAQAAPHEHLAARFAAKEAVVKALGLDGFDPLDIEVVGGGDELELRLYGPTAERARELGVEVAISLTHVPPMAAAVAVARPRDSE